MPFANTTNNYTGSSSGSLLTTTNWSLGHVPTVSEDAVFTATAGIRTLTSANLTVGSFNTTASSGTFSIRNATSTATDSSLILGGAGNSGNGVSGTAGDLLFVVNGTTFVLRGDNPNGTGVLKVVLGQSGNFDLAGTGAMTISAAISDAGSGFGITKTGAGTDTAATALAARATAPCCPEGLASHAFPAAVTASDVNSSGTAAAIPDANKPPIPSPS